jgi:hypothetical protein
LGVFYTPAVALKVDRTAFVADFWVAEHVAKYAKKFRLPNPNFVSASRLLDIVPGTPF